MKKITVLETDYAIFKQLKHQITLVLFFLLVALSGCSEELSLEADNEQTRAELEQELALLYGSWDDFCKIRLECEDYPFGYETVILNNVPYYFPLDVSRASRPNYFFERRPDSNFAQFSDDLERFRRIVSLDIKTLKEGDSDNIDHRLEFNSDRGLYPLAKYLGINLDRKNGVSGGLGGVLVIKEGRKPIFLESTLSEKTLKEIEGYQEGGIHDYDKNFWFISYGKLENDEVTESSSKELRFISKRRIFFNNRLYLNCSSDTCYARGGSFSSDPEALESTIVIPSVFNLPPRRKERYIPPIICENVHLDSCTPLKGLLDTVPAHILKIERIIDFISTKPESIVGYGQ